MNSYEQTRECGSIDVGVKEFFHSSFIFCSLYLIIFSFSYFSFCYFSFHHAVVNETGSLYEMIAITNQSWMFLQDFTFVQSPSVFWSMITHLFITLMRLFESLTLLSSGLLNIT